MINIANWCKVSMLAIGTLSIFNGLVANGSERNGALVAAPDMATTTPVEPAIQANSKGFAAYSEHLYKEINFGKFKKVSKEVFSKALHGYLNLKNARQVDNDRAILSICDFSLSSNVPRLWVIDLNTKKVLYNTLVAHGQGTGEEFATNFSNLEGSHQSSMGFFVTANTYYGDKGYSLKLQGKDNGYNDQAYNRAIVIHAADYVSYDFIKGNQRLGRSWGCPALPTELNRPIIDVIKGGTALFIYANNKNYFASSKWLKGAPETKEILNNNNQKLKYNNADNNTMLADVVVSPILDTSGKNSGGTKVTIKPKSVAVPSGSYFDN